MQQQQPNTFRSKALSRKEKAISHGYWTVAKRKRNNNDNNQHDDTSSSSSSCVKSQFMHVKSALDKQGIGTLATQFIQAGQILVSQERPIVAHVNSTRHRLCSACFTPIGTLNDSIQQIITGENDTFLDLFDLENLVFVSKDDIASCKCGAEYCSNECRIHHDSIHRYSCCQKDNNEWKKLEEYIDKSDYSIMLRLAIQCILKAMSYYKDGNTNDDNASFHWWREYHHPKWWEIQGTNENEVQQKNDICKTLSNLLKRVLLTNKVHKDCAWIHDLEQYLAEILGMLQCNVMEIRYPSPFHQFKSHLQHFIEDMKEYQQSQDSISENNDDDMTDAHMEAIENWIQKYSNEPEEIVGSGLFPILTLANHDCDPNASIEFLNDSGLGSMVALRDIPKGEEVAVIYIPNGDYYCGDVEGKRFENFQPTRTWKYLNEDRNSTCEVDHNDSGERLSTTESDCLDDCEIEDTIDNEDDQFTSEAAEGSTVEERQKAILSYDFQCACNRCRKELTTTSKSNSPLI